MLIYTSSVRRRMLTLLDFWVTMVAITSSVEWLYDVKWRETGFIFMKNFEKNQEKILIIT